MRCSVASASVMSSMLLAGVAVAQNEVRLTVRDYSGRSREQTAVRGGVPFCLGQLRDCGRVVLQTDTGVSVPCRVRPTARWHDGSVKWLLVDTLVDVPARGAVSLRLRVDGEAAQLVNTVSVTETDAAITVSSGAARFAFSKASFGLPSAAWVDLDGDGQAEAEAIGGVGEFVCEVEHTPPGPPEEENWLRDAAGTARERFSAAPSGDYRVVVEHASDLRAVVKLSGWLVNDEGRRLIQYVIRAHVCAGSREIRILPTFVYAGNPKEDFIRAMYIRFPRVHEGAALWALGGEQRHGGSLGADEKVSLFEVGSTKIYHLAPYTTDKTVRYSVVSGTATIAQGAEASGWARVADTGSSTHLAVRNFWQMHPKELMASRDGVTFYLWPEHGGKVLDLRRRSDEVDNIYHYDLSLWPYGGEGVAATHELLLRIGPPAEDAGGEMTGALNAPLLLQCTPEYYASTHAFGPFAPVDAIAYPHFEGVQNVITEWIRKNQRTFHWDGMIDYGDTFFHGYGTRSHYGYVCDKGWCSRGYVGWLCNDGTLTNSLFIQYLRSGDYETFLMAEAMARHVMDVDTCHHCAAEPGYVGGGHRHDQQHWGNGVRGYGTATHGAIDYYLLTGDERALEVAQEYAKYHTNGIVSENEDRIGGLIRMWEITGDPAMKAKADKLMAAELNVPADRQWPFVTKSHFRFVSNTSVSFVHYLYSAPPDDAARLRDAIVKAMDGREQQYLTTWEDSGYLTLILTSLAFHATGDQRYALMTASLLQPSRSYTPRQEEVPSDFLSVLRATDFEEMLGVARKWQINNIYIANIRRLCSLPYALSALRASGMDESGVYTAKLNSGPPPAFEEVLNNAKVSPWGKLKGRDSLAYSYRLANGAPSDKGGGRSRLALLEDGKPLSPRQAHIKIMREGGGIFSHWGAHSVIFSTSDNSDPRTNGREYKVVHLEPGE